jgi:ribosomal-protein-alanine N-acetyltransferase
MVYGPCWEFPLPKNQDVTVIMRPAKLADDARDMANLLRDGITHDFLSLGHSPTEQEELEHFEKIGQDSSAIDWMIAVRVDGHEELVGVTSLRMHGAWNYTRRLESGILLANRRWWGQGIASATHCLRTWYAFNTLGANVIGSGFFKDNAASGKALAGVGYIEIGRELRVWLKNGIWRDSVLLNCFNPAAIPVLWPHGDVPANITAALPKTLAALDWAREVLQPR